MAAQEFDPTRLAVRLYIYGGKLVVELKYNSTVVSKSNIELSKLSEVPPN